MTQELFIETKNVAAFRKAVNGLMKRDYYQPGFMVVEGESGRGKSMAADNWYGVNGGIFFRVWEGLTQHAFLQELAYKATESKIHGSNNCKRAIIERCEASPLAIIVDEADRLDLGRIEDLRDIHEESRATIVLIGEEGLKGKLRAKKRIYSRVAEVVNFEEVSTADVITYGAQMAGLTISPEAAALLVKKSEGSFRMVHNHMVKVAEYGKANNKALIEVKDLEQLNLRSFK